MKVKKNLKAHFEEYMDYCVHTRMLRSETLRGYRQTFENFSSIMPELDTPEALTSEAMDRFFKRLQERERTVGKGEKRKGVKASTIHTYGSKLHSFFEWLCVKGVMTKNPVIKKKLPQPVYDDKKELSGSEIEKIIAAITEHSKNNFIMRRDMAMVHVLLFNGLRKNELLHLRMSDIDLEKRTLVVRASTSKSKTPRTLIISAATLMHLEGYRTERRQRSSKCEYLWLSNNQDVRLTAHGLKHWVNRLRKHSGVSFHVHQFRHTHACTLLRKGVPLIGIQKLLGHKDIRMTEKYLRSYGIEDLRHLVEDLSLDDL